MGNMVCLLLTPLIGMEVGDFLDEVKIDKLSMKQHFNHLGGNSIKAIQISSRLRQNNFQLSVKDILENSVFEDMAKHMEYLYENNTQQNSVEGFIEDTTIIKWLKDQNEIFINSYAQQTIIKINEIISVEQVQQIIYNLIKHHDILRVNIDSVNNKLFYNNAYLTKIPYIQFLDWSEKTKTEKAYFI